MAGIGRKTHNGILNERFMHLILPGGWFEQDAERCDETNSGQESGQGEMKSNSDYGKALYWVFMMLGGVVTGAGFAITLRWGLQGIGIGAVIAALTGLGFLTAGVWMLFLREDPVQGSSAGPQLDIRPPGAKAVEETALEVSPAQDKEPGVETGFPGDAPPAEMDAIMLCSFLVHELDRVLELLKRSRGREDIDALQEPVAELEIHASELALKKDELKVGTRRIKELWKVKNSLAVLERKWILRTGGDLHRDVMEGWNPKVCLSAQEMEDCFTRCSERLAHVSRQFNEQPEFRDALVATARSIRIYMGRPVERDGRSSGEEAFAATLRLPDLSTLEKMIYELGELEKGRNEDGFDNRSERAAEEHGPVLRKLMAVAGSPESLAAWPELKELSMGLQNACDSLETGKLDNAIKHLDGVIRLVRDSPVGGS